MVTARASEADRVRGFEIGADDYVVKPFSTPELVARVRAVSRRASNESAHDGMIGHADLRLDLAAHRAWNGDEELHLSRKEFELLRMLMMRPAEVVRRDELVRAIWNVPLAEGAASLDVHVSWLRAKLGDDPRRPRYIETVRGIGLRLVGGSP
jgi:DNA-binding response OmpR family regulator